MQKIETVAMNCNGRVYPKEVYMKAIQDYEEKMETQLYCCGCLHPWEKGVTNLNSFADNIACPGCGSKTEPGITKEQMRDRKIKNIVNE